MKNKYIAALTLATTLIASCATPSYKIATAYASPFQYQSYTCDQLMAEDIRIRQRITQLSGRLDQAATNDKVLTGVGIVLFWPVLFALGGTKEQEAELSRLKGDLEAIHQAAIIKNCAFFMSQQPSQSPSPSP